MAQITLEPSTAMPSMDWRDQSWLNTEHAVICRLPEQVGWMVYVGPGWSNRQIHNDPTWQGVISSRFHWGRCGREQQEREQQP